MSVCASPPSAPAACAGCCRLKVDCDQLEGVPYSTGRTRSAEPESGRVKETGMYSVAPGCTSMRSVTCSPERSGFSTSSSIPTLAALRTVTGEPNTISRVPLVSPLEISTKMPTAPLPLPWPSVLAPARVKRCCAGLSMQTRAVAVSSSRNVM